MSKAARHLRWDPRSAATGWELLPLSSEGGATIHVPTSAMAYEAGLEGLTRINEELLSALQFPPIYAADVQYRRETEDTWRHCLDVFRSHWGDCEDLAAWRAAELRVSGEDPDAFVYVYRSGPTRYHAVTGRGDGTVEDPSYILGMKVPRGWQPIQYVGEQRHGKQHPRRA